MVDPENSSDNYKTLKKGIGTIEDVKMQLRIYHS